MPGWADLYGSLSTATAAERAARGARAEFDRWCRLAIASLAETLFGLASARSRDILERTGVSAEVEYGAGSPRASGESDPRFRTVAMMCRGGRVDLYCGRSEGALPFVHLAHFSRMSHMAASAAPKRPVVVSLPGCRVERGAQGELRLRDLAAPAPGNEMTADELVLRAFTILLRAY